VLNGVGGRTIEEAKERISTEEFGRWCAYREMCGGLNPATVMVPYIGRLTYLLQAVHGGKGRYEEFVPQYHLPGATEEQANIDAAANLAQAMKEWR